MGTPKLKCPRCYELLGAVRTEEGVSVDFCRDCGGIWLDKGELDQLLSMVGADPQPSSESTPIYGLRCPSCRSDLAEVEHPPGSGILLDTCGSCGGVWLDRGEIAKLQQRAHTREGKAAFQQVGRSNTHASKPERERRTADGQLLIPIIEVESSTQGEGIDIKWLVISTMVMCSALGMLSMITEALWIAEEVTQEGTDGTHLLVIMASGLAFLFGGFTIGWRSPGHTIWEPPLAAVPASLAFGVLFWDMFSALELGAIIGIGCLLAFVGGVFGERYQAN